MKIRIICLFSLVYVASAFSQPKDTAWKQLSLREKIGQTMLMLPDRKLELELGNGSLEAYFKRYPVSGYFMGWKLFTGIPDADRV